MEQSPASDNKKRVILGIVAVAMLALLATGVFALRGNNDQTASTNNQASTSESATPSASTSTTTKDSPQTLPETSSTPAATYKDGTYSAAGSYSSPGGTERVAVTITLAGDKITEATVEPQAASPTSKQYQGQFVSNFKQFVVGKDADQVSLGKVSGSSLTSRGFNSALDQIKEQAKA